MLMVPMHTIICRGRNHADICRPVAARAIAPQATAHG